jgi:hypothetical protein
MSKFIRTKNGIYELKENMTIEKGIYSFFGKIYNTPEKHLFRNDKDLGEFVSQADTIDELCDGFYIDDGQEFCLEDVFTNFDKFKSSYKYYNRYCVGKYEGYGFIKTSQGLVYAAKINKEKGDLELI